jgi:WD40 repeat protein
LGWSIDPLEHVNLRYDKTVKLDSSVVALELLPNGQIACLTLFGRLYFWNPDSDYMNYSVVINRKDITHFTKLCMTQLASGDLCISSNCCDGKLTVWDFKTHQKIKAISIGHFNRNLDGRRAIKYLES